MYESIINNLSIFCADIGSIKSKKFGWAAMIGEIYLSDNSINNFASKIADEIKNKRKVALGFECPLFVPIRSDPEKVNSARNGEGNRSWSAGAGTGALATGLVEVLWVMNKINELLGYPPKAQLKWSKFISSDSVFLWEAFVTSTAKGIDHSDDAFIAVKRFRNSLPNLELANSIQEEQVLSLVGAAALRAGWSHEVSLLSEKCIVIKA